MANVTFGFIGSGEVSPRAIKAILRDQVNAVDSAKFILPLTEEHFHDGIAVVAEFALDNEIPYEIVTDDSALKGVKEIISGATKEHSVEDVPTKVISLLEAAADPVLVVFWDDDVAADAFERADALEIPTHDITNGFDKVEFAEEEPEPEPEGEGEPVPDAAGEPGPTDGDDDEREQPRAWTEDELSEIDDVDYLKRILAEVGGEPLAARSRKPTYVAAILKAQGGAQASQEEPEQESEEDASPIPQEDTSASVPGDDEPQDAPRPSGTGLPSLVGNCHACGGPIFATYDREPVVIWDHAKYCVLKTGEPI